MWTRGKNSSQLATRTSFAIRRRSKTPGVMITQYTATLPEGKSTPDIQCKPMPVSVKEGNLAVFKAVVTGDPKPDVSWRRAKGNLADKEKFQRKYDESTGEHILEIHKLSAAEADTYKCYAVNEYGKAVCTTTLNVIDGSTNPEDFRKLLKKSKVQTPGGENDETFWNAMLSADKRDYESICSAYGVADLNMVLKKLEEKKKQKGKNKHKDGVISFDADAEEQGKHSLGRKNVMRIEGLVQNDSAMYIGDVEEANCHNRQLSQVNADRDLLLKEFKLSNVDFVIKIQEIKAEENDDALFECVLTHPLPKITWMRKGIVLEDGEKYNITLSDNKLIHRLLIRDCSKLDKGIYSAIAGITSCSAWLVVEDQCNPPVGGRKTIRKSATAAGAQTDLEKVAKERQIKIQEEMEKILKAVKGTYTEAEKQKEEMLTGRADYGGRDKKNPIEGELSEEGQDAGPETNSIHVQQDQEAECDAISEKQLIENDVVQQLNQFRGKQNFNKSATTQMKTKNVHWKEHASDPIEGELSEEGQDAGPETNSIHVQQDQEAECDAINEKQLIENDVVQQLNQFRGKQNCNKSATTQMKTKNVHWKEHTSDYGQVSDDELNNTDENEDSADQGKYQRSLKHSKKSKHADNGKCVFPEDHDDCDEAENMSNSFNHTRLKRQVPLIADSVIGE
ncbi:hypothetical protein ILYODFUR_019024 [Ilyodon furcidens]|uniref:Ig-like domain-containing protein n=1 Tax=Ilyodon furcidens TaxID=33524 RepID=A0ABV0V4A2_9TELE